eukprot:scaffold2145_cov309-Prasinococcus_capsulatus_cf.AAC.10
MDGRHMLAERVALTVRGCCYALLRREAGPRCDAAAAGGVDAATQLRCHGRHVAHHHGRLRSQLHVRHVREPLPRERRRRGPQRRLTAGSVCGRSNIVPIRLFGLFMALLVLYNYVLVVLYFPALLVLQQRAQRCRALLRANCRRAARALFAMDEDTGDGGPYVQCRQDDAAEAVSPDLARGESATSEHEKMHAPPAHRVPDDGASDIAGRGQEAHEDAGAADLLLDHQADHEGAALLARDGLHHISAMALMARRHSQGDGSLWINQFFRTTYADWLYRCALTRAAAGRNQRGIVPARDGRGMRATTRQGALGRDRGGGGGGDRFGGHRHADPDPPAALQPLS